MFLEKKLTDCEFAAVYVADTDPFSFGTMLVPWYTLLWLFFSAQATSNVKTCKAKLSFLFNILQKEGRFLAKLSPVNFLR